jgi:hypothetical protein
MSDIVTVVLDGAGESREFLDGSRRAVARLPSLLSVGRFHLGGGWARAPRPRNLWTGPAINS